MFIKFVVKVAACLVVACTVSVPSSAQQTPSAGSDSSAQTQAQDPGKPASAPSNSAQPADPVKDSKQAGQGKVAGTSNDRLLYTLPNFLTLENAGKLPPMPVKDKYKVVALSTFDPVNYPWWGLLSAIGQADNSEPQYGQGWAAYGKRYATTASDSIIENFMVGAVFPSALHQDPRFYESGKGSFGRRLGYGMERMVVTLSDSGHKQFNYSEIFGAAFAAAVSTYSYHPRGKYVYHYVDHPSSGMPNYQLEYLSSDRTLRNAASVWGTQLSLDTLTYVVKEFWPDIHRMLGGKHKNDAAAPASSKP